MRSFRSFETILLHRLPVDGRKQINGLVILAQEAMRVNPVDGGLFVFVNKGRDTIRLLYWDKSGFAMWVKRLEKERFRWPLKMSEEVVHLAYKQLAWILDGLDIMQLQPHKPLHFSALT